MAPHWFAVTRLTDNRLSGLMREIAEMIDGEDDIETLRDLMVSLHCLGDGARSKTWLLGQDRIRQLSRKA